LSKGRFVATTKFLCRRKWEEIHAVGPERLFNFTTKLKQATEFVASK